MTTSITDQLAEVQKMLTPEKLSTLSARNRAQVLELMAALESSVRREQSQDSFLTFCSSVWPAFMEGGTPP